jgi:hypothetical protein
MVMVFNATFNNILVMLWWSVLFVEETGVPRGIDHLESILIVPLACLSLTSQFAPALNKDFFFY